MVSINIPKAEKIAKLSFILLMFFSFFGTSLPFASRLESAEDVGTSNIINVLVFPVLFLFSLIAFLNKIEEVLNFVKKEKVLVILLGWALLSVAWSGYPMVSFKRWFQIFDSYFVIIVFLAFVKDKKEVFDSIKPILFSYIIISIISVIIIPGAKDLDFGTWRGLASSKNNLGHISITCIITSFILYSYSAGQRERLFSLISILISVALLIGTFSSTAYIAFLVFGFTLLITFLSNKIFGPIGVRNFVLAIFFLSIIIIVLFITYLNPEFSNSVTGLFGKDTSFSDRTYLWEYITMQIQKHPFWGCGFQGFWVIGSPQIEMLYSVFVWFPQQAHNGYLDLINEIGLIGFVIFIFFVVRYLLIVLKQKELDFSVWFIISSLIINFTETTLFRPGYLISVFVVLGYLLLFVEKKETNNYAKKIWSGSRAEIAGADKWSIKSFRTNQ